MKQIFISLLLLCSLLPFSSTAQIGVADPLTGNALINFYGRVLDQDGKPIAGAKVTIDVLAGYLPSPAILSMRHDKATLQTDANGDFALTGSSGHSLKVESVEESGYKLSEKVVRQYPYSWAGDIFHPDAKNPIIFRMWKKTRGEALISDGKFYGINPDGRPYTMDFLKKKKFEGIEAQGDIIVRIQRPLAIKPRAQFDWSYSIEAIGGGIIQNDDDFMFRAPEAGYKAKYEFAMTATSTNWQFEIKDQQFYIKSRNGKVYGSLIVRVIPDYKDRSVFDVHYVVNPSGSRNLER